MRAADTSSVYSWKVVHVRTTPGAVGLFILSTTGPGSELRLENCCRCGRRNAVCAWILRMQRGFDERLPILFAGNVLVSTRSPLRIAVIGLQKLNVSLASNTDMCASAPAISTNARRRAFSISLRPRRGSKFTHHGIPAIQASHNPEARDRGLFRRADGAALGAQHSDFVLVKSPIGVGKYRRWAGGTANSFPLPKALLQTTRLRLVAP